MGIHASLESKGRASSIERRLSTYAHGLRLLKSIMRRKIIQKVKLEEIHFRALAILAGEMFVNNKGSWMGIELDLKSEKILDRINTIIKEQEIRYPFFRPETLETTIFWTGVLDKNQCTGYIHFREPRADGAHDFGHIEIDVFETESDKEDAILSSILIEKVKSEKLEMAVLEDIASVFIDDKMTSQIYRYKTPIQIVFSDSDKPIPKFYESYVFGVRSGKKFPKFFRDTLNEMPHLWEAIAEKRQYPDYDPPVGHLKQVFATIRPTLLDGVLGKPSVYNQLLENSQKAEISLIAGSLIVSSEKRLWGFLEAMIKTYDSELTPIYEIIIKLRKKLGVKVIRM